MRRTLQKLGGDDLDTVIGHWTAARADRSAARRAIAGDGKTLRGAPGPDGRARHLMAVIDHHAGVVLGQVDVDGKTNEVRREAPCRIPNSVRRNSEDSSWVRWLTWSRKVMGTRACHEHRRSCSDARSDALGAPCDTAKAGLPEA